jgi:hypothetical protein
MSQFVKCIVGDVPTNVVAFGWSGRNSHQARIKAGNQLAQYLRRHSTETGCLRYHLVAHSHGGNVALHAIRDNYACKLVKSFTFLGTPFFYITKRKFGAQVVLLLLILLLSAYRVQIVGSLEKPLHLIMGLLCVVFLLYLYFGVNFGRLFKILVGVANAATSPMQDFYIGKIATPQPNQPVYVASIARDEARLWLSVIDRSSSLSWNVWDLAARVIGWSIASIICLAMFEKVTHSGQGYAGSSFLIAVVIGALLVSPLIGIVISNVIRNNPFTIGGEGVIAHMLLRIEPEELPSWQASRGSLYERISTSGGTGLRHSRLHEDTALASRIHTWLSTPLSRELPRMKFRYVNHMSASRTIVLPLMTVVIMCSLHYWWDRDADVAAVAGAFLSFGYAVWLMFMWKVSE